MRKHETLHRQEVREADTNVADLGFPPGLDRPFIGVDQSAEDRDAAVLAAVADGFITEDELLRNR